MTAAHSYVYVGKLYSIGPDDQVTISNGYSRGKFFSGPLGMPGHLETFRIIPETIAKLWGVAEGTEIKFTTEDLVIGTRGRWF